MTIPTRKRMNRGFSTLEMMIAMTILILTLTSVTLVASGNQMMIVDSQTSTEGVVEAQALLERAQALARKDFHLVNPQATTTKMSGSLGYEQSVDVEVLPDLLTKRVTSHVAWAGEHARTRSVALSTLVTNFDNVRSADTCSSVLSGDWTNPQIKNGGTTDFATLIGDGGGTYPVSDIEAYRSKLYVTTNNTIANTNKTFFVLDASSESALTLLGATTTATTSSPGLSALTVASTSAGLFAFVASADAVNFGTCVNNNDTSLRSTVYGGRCAQLQVIDLTDATKPTAKYFFKAQGVTGNGGDGSGKSIIYKDGYVYLGLKRTGTGPEFHIIDVHDPLRPFEVGSWPSGGVSFGSDINAITVKGNYAFLATNDTTKHFVVLDVSNPVNPTLVGTYNGGGGATFGYGRALSLVGETLYTGRSYTSSAPEFAILDASSTPPIPFATPMGVDDIGPNSTAPFSVGALLVRDTLAFIIGGSPSQGGKLLIKNVSMPSAIAPHADLTLPGGPGVAMDCERNTLYIGSNETATERGFLSVISPP